MVIHKAGANVITAAAGHLKTLLRQLVHLTTSNPVPAFIVAHTTLYLTQPPEEKRHGAQIDPNRPPRRWYRLRHDILRVTSLEPP